MPQGYETLGAVPPARAAKSTLIVCAIGMLATMAAICIISTFSPVTKRSSLMEYAVVTDDVAPRFMRNRADKHKHLTASLAEVFKAGSAQAKAFLEIHNKYRAAHGAPALVWDDTLAAASDAFADKCIFGHDKNRGPGIGENIYAAGSSAPLSDTDTIWATESTSDWYNEISDWNFALGKTKGGVTGHFTQVVWKATTKLGCAIANCPGMLMENSVFVVCRYSPGGNFVCPTCTPPITYVDNVLPKK